MIDRENKKIINGFGTIAVGSYSFKQSNWILSHIEPPKEVGSDIRKEDVAVIDSVKFDLSYEEIEQLSKDLENVTPENNKIYLRDWEINFEHFDQKSVNVYKNACMNMRGILQIALAC